MNTQLDNSKYKLAGHFNYQHIRDGVIIDEWKEPNLVVDEGLEYALANSFDGATPSETTWFIGLFTGNYTPVNTDTAATFPADATETTTQYSEATRPVWVQAGVTANAIGNSASPGIFTFTAPTTNVYGAFLVSSNVKGGTAGILTAASRFASLRVMLDTDKLNVTYVLTASSS